MQSITDYNFKDKRVLVRCDFNVPLEAGKISDDFKINQALPTINYLTRQGAKVVLMSHLGRPEVNSKFKVPSGRTQSSKFSLRPVAQHLAKLLKIKIKFVSDCLSNKAKRAVNKLKPGQILLLENVRFKKGEELNDSAFTAGLAKLGDVYVNEAFSVCHRSHASVVGLAKVLPHFAGFCLEKEVEVLSNLLQYPKRPLVVIIGGAKLSSKIDVIDNFLKKADHILLGGQIVNSILTVKGICVGRPWPEQSVVDKINRIDLTNPKIHLPLDALVSPDEQGDVYIKNVGPGYVRNDEKLLDIGEETIHSFAKIIEIAATVFWSGPLGFFENEKFSHGTEQVAKSIANNQDAFTVAGGGDTIAALRKHNLLHRFCHISTGGGAMLAFLAEKEMPGLDALRA